jgi:hypothetical protein
VIFVDRDMQLRLVEGRLVKAAICVDIFSPAAAMICRLDPAAALDDYV